MKVVFTDGARADLAAIGREIQKHNPGRAETFIEELYERCRLLGRTPRAFPLLPKWEEHGIRRRPYGNYLIFYRVRGDSVQILHLLHGARDYEAILFPEA